MIAVHFVEQLRFKRRRAGKMSDRRLTIFGVVGCFKNENHTNSIEKRD